MKHVKQTYSYVIFAISVFIFQSCSTAPVNLGIVKDNIINYHKTGKYDHEVNKVISEAEDEFTKFFDKQEVSDSDIVIFDVDETALSNYDFNKSIGFGYSTELWDAWIDSASAPAIPQVKKLYDFLVKHKVKIVFVTGRKNYQQRQTSENLKAAGYTTFDTLITRQPSERSMTAFDYKSRIRLKLTHAGYHIIGDVGDQWSDLRGPYHGIQVKIPNYQYIIN